MCVGVGVSMGMGMSMSVGVGMSVSARTALTQLGDDGVDVLLAAVGERKGGEGFQQPKRLPDSVY
mgnify:CR=1 FL=1